MNKQGAHPIFINWIIQNVSSCRLGTKGSLSQWDEAIGRASGGTSMVQPGCYLSWPNTIHLLCFLYMGGQEKEYHIYLDFLIYIFIWMCVLMPVCMYLCVCIYTHIKIYSTTILFNGARFCSCFVWKTVTTDPSALTCLEWNIICTVITLSIASLKQICPLPCCTACNTVEWNYASFIKKKTKTHKP